MLLPIQLLSVCPNINGSQVGFNSSHYRELSFRRLCRDWHRQNNVHRYFSSRNKWKSVIDEQTVRPSGLSYSLMPYISICYNYIHNDKLAKNIKNHDTKSCYQSWVSNKKMQCFLFFYKQRLCNIIIISDLVKCILFIRLLGIQNKFIMVVYELCLYSWNNYWSIHYILLIAVK